MIKKLDYTFDLAEIRSAVDTILEHVDWHPHHFQICLNNIEDKTDWYFGTGSLIWNYDAEGNRVPFDPPIDQYGFRYMNDLVRGTILEEIYNTISKEYKPSRYRLMLLKHKKCMSIHSDSTPRLHVPVYSNPNARLVIADVAHYLKDDGSVYWADTTKPHTAFNGDHKQDRIHLLIDL